MSPHPALHGGGEQNRSFRGEGGGGGRLKNTLLCGTFEALVGALLLDSGLDTVVGFIEPKLEEVIGDVLSNQRDQDPKSLLQEWIQAKGKEPPIYETIGESGPEHDKTFRVAVLVEGKDCGQGVGHNKQSAAKAAAIKALEALK